MIMRWGVNSCIIYIVVLSWFQTLFATDGQCNSLFLGSNFVDRIEFEKVVKQIDSKTTSFARFQKFSELTGKRMYTYQTFPMESSQASQPILDKIYPTSKSVVGIEIVRRGPFNLTEKEIMDHIELVVRDRDARGMFSEVYKALSLLQINDKDKFSAVIGTIRHFILQDFLRIRHNDTIVKKSDPKAGMDDPGLEQLYYGMRFLNILQDPATDIFQRIRKVPEIREHLLTEGVEEVALLMSCMKLIVLLYYDFYFNEPLYLNCTATVLSDSILLTAAHCIYKSNSVLYYHKGQMVESISIDYHPEYKGTPRMILDRDILEEIPMAQDIGIVIFPKGTFSDIPSSSLSFNIPEVGERVISTGFRIMDTESRVVLGQVTDNKFVLEVTPQLLEEKVIMGESGGALFDKFDRVVGVTVGAITDEEDGKVVNMYSLTSTNKEYLLDLASKYEGIKIEEE